MLCRKFRQTLFAKTTLKNNVQYQCLITSRFFSKRCIFFDRLLAYKSDSRVRMSSIRLVWRDLSVARLWGAWTRSFIVNTVVKRCRRERSVREVFQCFRQTILRPRRTLLLSATAAFKSEREDDKKPPSCEQGITDEDLEALMSELEAAEQLSRSSLFCSGCGKRLVVDKKQPAVRYCACKEPKPAEEAPDGWVPYMEAEDVIIWRKEYKPGKGLYAYKVYGRYKEVRAADFAAVQVDEAYRRVWDAAVASLAVVERAANGLRDQDVLHWEVLWPRLFANRDYVYIRRHKEFDVHCPSHAGALFEATPPAPPPPPPSRPSVHERAKRRAMELDRLQQRVAGPSKDNKAFVIISRSCSHPRAPETKHAIRVYEYWSHMVVRSIDGASEPGMEFVLTYYDEPGVGGMPVGVAAWATGRAAPAYLQRMRNAARRYPRPQGEVVTQELGEFTPLGPSDDDSSALSEQDMESSKHGPDLDNGDSREQSTQTEESPAPADHAPGTPTETDTPKEEATKEVVKAVPEVKAETPANSTPSKEEATPNSQESEDKLEDEESPANGSWWRYLYPFYYFV